MNKVAISLPRFQDLMWPTLEALRSLGGSGTVQEIDEQVLETNGYSDQQRAVLHRGGPRTELAYLMAWARNYLKRAGALENSQRGVWSITDAGRSLVEPDMAGIPAKVRVRTHSSSSLTSEDEEHDSNDEPFMPEELVEPETGAWQERLLRTLLELEPSSFERLAQRLLREQGLINVKVTGRTGDGGIDGTGILRMHMLSFPMFFQCKRYRGSVGASAVRDFRGAMVGRSDKGVLITTGHFTPDAIREANRDGAPPIDLVDGE